MYTRARCAARIVLRMQAKIHRIHTSIAQLLTLLDVTSTLVSCGGGGGGRHPVTR